MTLKKILEWYTIVDTFHNKNQVMQTDMKANSQVFLMRLKPEFRDRMIRSGYSYDPTGFNKKSMGSLMDMNKGYVGYESPLKD